MLLEMLLPALLPLLLQVAGGLVLHAPSTTAGMSPCAACVALPPVMAEPLLPLRLFLLPPLRQLWDSSAARGGRYLPMLLVLCLLLQLWRCRAAL